jgi:hypothetical protein
LVSDYCARCGRTAPPMTDGPEGMEAQGWVTYEGEPKLVVEVPREATLLPAGVRAEIGIFAGLVCVEPTDVEVAWLREIVTSFAGNACPACIAETGWDDFQWKLFLAGLAESQETA